MDSPEHDFVVLGDKDVAGTDSTGILPLSPEQIQEIRAWLHPTDYSADSSEYKRHLLSYVCGTGKWMQEPQYQQWMDAEDHGALWVKAIPGAGKSVIAAHLASHLGKDGRVPVLYFFFRQIISSNQTPNSLLHDWMSQLLEYSPSLQSTLKLYLDKRRSLDSVAFEELWHSLTRALCNLSRVYCVADALDEMNLGNDSFIKQLASLGQLKPASIKVLMTSRPIPRIEKILKKPYVLQITLGQNLVDQDIAVYVEHRLIETGLPKSTWKNVQHSLTSKSQGLFLYTKLMMDDLMGSKAFDVSNTASLRDAVDRLPYGLAEMYTRMLHDHSVRSRVPQQLQLIILQWVTQSFRPLRLLEIAAMIDSSTKQFNLDVGTKALEGSPNTKAAIRKACGPLLEIMEDETVSIIHHSFTEYLIDLDRAAKEHNKFSFPSIDSVQCHHDMAIACIDYLTSGGWADDFQSKADKNAGPYFRSTVSPELIAVYAKHPFLKYSSSYWYYHANKFGQADETLFQSLDRFLSPDSKSFAPWLKLRKVETGIADTSAIHVAAGEGLALYVEHLIQRGQNPNALDNNERTPVHRAAAKGHSQAVQVLLKHGANPDPDDKDNGLKPLHLAASSNHAGVIKDLLKAGVDPKTPKTKRTPGNWCGNAPRSYGDTAVMYAFECGHTEAALEFVPYLKPHDLDQALNWAAEAGRTETVLRVLDTGKIEVNKVTDGKTLLYLAAYKHDLRIMQKLLSLGADVKIRCNSAFGNARERYGGPNDAMKSTPLHAFARNCNFHSRNNINREKSLPVLRLLLESECEANAVDATGNTPLHLALGRAFTSTDEQIIVEMLNNGADPSAKNDDGSQPLHLAKHNGPIVHHLVDHDADVNARNSVTGKTPLLYSIEDYHDDVFLVLIERGADCSAQDLNGDSPLHLALRASHYSKLKVEMLLKKGADPNVKNRKGETPLHGMREGNHLDEILPLLMSAGADLEIKTPSGKTVLMQFLPGWQSRMSPDFLPTLLDSGARIDSRDCEGKTILHLLCEGAQSAPLIGSLVEAGADPQAVDFAGNTLLHYVARQTASFYSQEQQQLFDLLLELGINTDVRNNLGQTPFHIAVGTR